MELESRGRLHKASYEKFGFHKEFVSTNFVDLRKKATKSTKVSYEQKQTTVAVVLDCELAVLEEEEDERQHFQRERTLNYRLDPFAFDDEQLVCRYRLFNSYFEIAPDLEKVN